MQDVQGLLAYLRADSLDEAGALVSEDTDPDAWFVMDGDQLVLSMGGAGFTLEFPLSTADFWEMIHELETDAVSASESESE